MYPKFNDDGDDGNDNDDVFPINLDGNGFENVANRDDFGFITKTPHEIIFYIVNKSPLPYNFAI